MLEILANSEELHGHFFPISLLSLKSKFLLNVDPVWCYAAKVYKLYLKYILTIGNNNSNVVM